MSLFYIDTSTNERSGILQKSYSVYCFILKFVLQMLYLTDVYPFPPKNQKNSDETTEQHGDRWQIAGVWGIPRGGGVDIGQI